MTQTSATTARLLITCPDRPGIVAAVAGFFHMHGANITALDQHSTDPTGGTFFMRVEFQTPSLDLSRAALGRAFAAVVGDRFAMDWRLSYADDTKDLAILVSKHDHALMELLWRSTRGELEGRVAMVISNHRVAEAAVTALGVPFHYVPVTAKTKAESEARIVDLLGDSVKTVALARYMQILSPELVAKFPNQIINIHHSFLPAFVGANPYHRAFERGVKLIGATAHYVTAELDAGPIIEQDVGRVSHRDSVEDLIALGRDLERRVLANAVRWHLEDRVLVHGNKTVVFR